MESKNGVARGRTWLKGCCQDEEDQKGCGAWRATAELTRGKAIVPCHGQL